MNLIRQLTEKARKLFVILSLKV